MNNEYYQDFIKILAEMVQEYEASDNETTDEESK
ncbi:hypothetical protein QFZ81_005763 [Paenibacillus sp. V4I9]|nr:hypothetical protein [Paenibacillus sp. V4I9]